MSYIYPFYRPPAVYLQAGPWDFIPFVVFGGVALWMIMQKNKVTTTPRNPAVAKRDLPGPAYRPLEDKENEGRWQNVKPTNIVSTEDSALNQCPKTILEGAGGVKYLCRTTPAHIKSNGT